MYSRPVRHPLVILGLDGGDWQLLDRLFAAGAMPHLEALATRGLRTELRSTLPPATLPAWTAFLCGAEPSAHGVLDMFVHRDGAYGVTPATPELRRLPTFLERLAEDGLAVASLGVPGTYPPPRALGLCVSGFDAPGASHAGPRAIWPRAARSLVARHGGWRYAVFNEQRAGGARRAASALVADLAVKEAIVLDALASRAWDVFFVHLQASDTAGHHLWHTFDTTSPRYPGVELADALPSVYRRLDALIGRVCAALPPEARILVVSDHGMGGASDIAVHLNRALHELGVLRFRERAGGARRLAGRLVRRAVGALSPELLGLGLRLAPGALTSHLLALSREQAVDFAESEAFSDELDYGPAVWVNRRGAFARGHVDERAAPTIAARIREHLLALRHPRTGKALVRAVYRRDELHAGPLAALAPDLVIEPAWPDGYRPSFLASPGPGPSVRTLESHELAAPRGSGMPGVHRREGMLLACGPGLPALEAPALAIAEAGALVYALAGYGAPNSVVSRPRGFWRELAESLGTGSAPPGDGVPALAGYDEAEREVLTRRLRDLGYIE